MSVFKVQRIRSCVQCGDVLGLKCKNCIKHPERKPRVIDFYDWPEILKTAECGCCIQIRCQADGCGKLVWRNAKHNRGGKAISKAFYCSISCSARSMAMARCKRQSVPCAYCSKMVVKKMFSLKTWVRSFCNNTCYFLFRAKTKHEAKMAAKEDEEARALLWCEKCRDVTDHDSTNLSKANCRPCAALAKR